jgi:hypothetical protein
MAKLTKISIASADGHTGGVIGTWTSHWHWRVTPGSQAVDARHQRGAATPIETAVPVRLKRTGFAAIEPSGAKTRLRG